jgi:diacylglycerol O-acyltransferase 2, plant
MGWGRKWQAQQVLRVQVSRRVFHETLATRRHVLLCPGGMAELLHAAEVLHSADPTVRLCTRHCGFCRIAAQHGAAVVPILVFGEVFHLRNLWPWLWLQRVSYHVIGAPREAHASASGAHSCAVPH